MWSCLLRSLSKPANNRIIRASMVGIHFPRKKWCKLNGKCATSLTRYFDQFHELFRFLMSFWYFRFWKRKHFFSSCQVHLSGASPVCHFASIIDTTARPRACLQMFFRWLQMLEMFNKLIVYWLCWYHFQVLKWLSHASILFFKLYNSQSPFLR